MLLALLATGSACGQADEQSQGEKPKESAPAPADKNAKDSVAGRFDDWVLVCSESGNKKGPCSLVQTLVEQKSGGIVFRLRVGYGAKGNLLLVVRSPTNVTLQKGFEFSPDGTKVYRLSLRYGRISFQGFTAGLADEFVIPSSFAGSAEPRQLHGKLKPSASHTRTAVFGHLGRVFAV